MQEEFFIWNKTFDTNIIKIDLQHKVIIKILNELYNIIIGENKEEEVLEIVNELIQYTEYHFSEEEKMFDKYDYIEGKSHKIEHQKFVEKIQVIVSQINTDKGMLAIELMNFLKDWLTEHILDTDQKYVSFFREKGIVI